MFYSMNFKCTTKCASLFKSKTYLATLCIAPTYHC